MECTGFFVLSWKNLSMVFFLVPQLCVYKGATAGGVENHVDMNCLEVRITSNSLLDY